MAEIIKDDVLGEIECKDGFEIKVKWVDNAKLNVAFDLYENQTLNEGEKGITPKEKMEDRIKTLKEILSDVEGWDKRIKENTARIMLELANDWFDIADYYDEDEVDDFIEEMKETVSEESAEKLRDSEITEEFLEKILLVENLTIYGNGNFGVLLYDDEIVFGGHLIDIAGNINGEFLEEGDIAG